MKRTKFGDHDVYLDDRPIYVTDDYSIFEYWPGNRLVFPKKVKPIIQSIKQRGWMDNSIILLGPNNWIGDGQHRVTALREIQKESGKTYMIRYQVDESLTLDDVIRMNSISSKWNAYDHLHSNCSKGLEEYLHLRNYLRQYNFPVYTGAILAQGVNNTGSDWKVRFETGQWAADNWERAHIRATNVKEMKRLFDRAENVNHVKAMMAFWRHPGFNHKIYIHKMELNRSMLYPCSTTEQYREMIKKLYNYKNQNKIRDI